MSSWHEKYSKRKFYRIENALEDFKDCIIKSEVLPYRNYPMEIEVGQIFMIEYIKNDSQEIDTRFYLADGTTWKDMPTTRAIDIHNKYVEPKMQTLTIKGKEYKAMYYGEYDISSWCKTRKSRKFWKLLDAYEDFKDCSHTGDVLPFNNYPFKVELKDVFVIEYTNYDDSTEIHYHIANGEIWQGKESTVKVII